MVYLANQPGTRPATIGAITEGAAAPRKFLEAILLELKRRHLLVSTRGRFGGYMLAKPASEITFADVIRGLDGPLALAPCASRTAYHPCSTCPDVDTCPIRPALVAGRDAISAVLDGWTLDRASEAGALLTP